MTKECIQQFTLRISQANSTELVVILYEMLLTYLEEAKEEQQKQDDNGFKDRLRKCRGCINELSQSLHPEYEIAQNLQKLYFYCLRELAHAQTGDPAALDKVSKVIAPLRDAYREVAKQNPAGPVLVNSQTIVAGLTYGRNTLTEDVTDQGTNRGMRV